MKGKMIYKNDMCTSSTTTLFLHSIEKYFNTKWIVKELNSYGVKNDTQALGDRFLQIFMNIFVCLFSVLYFYLQRIARRAPPLLVSLTLTLLLDSLGC